MMKTRTKFETSPVSTSELYLHILIEHKNSVRPGLAPPNPYTHRPRDQREVKLETEDHVVAMTGRIFIKLCSLSRREVCV